MVNNNLPVELHRTTLVFNSSVFTFMQRFWQINTPCVIVQCIFGPLTFWVFKSKIVTCQRRKPSNKQYDVNKIWNLNDTATLMCVSYITDCKEVSVLILSMLITLLNRTYRDRKSMWTSGPMFRSVLSGLSMCRMSVSKPVNRIQIKIVF